MCDRFFSLRRRHSGFGFQCPCDLWPVTLNTDAHCCHLVAGNCSTLQEVCLFFSVGFRQSWLITKLMYFWSVFNPCEVRYCVFLMLIWMFSWHYEHFLRMRTAVPLLYVSQHALGSNLKPSRHSFQIFGCLITNPKKSDQNESSSFIVVFFLVFLKQYGYYYELLYVRP